MAHRRLHDGKARIHARSMKIKNWTVRVQDRGKWRDVLEKAKTFNIWICNAYRRRRRRRRHARSRMNTPKSPGTQTHALTHTPINHIYRFTMAQWIANACQCYVIRTLPILFIIIYIHDNCTLWLFVTLFGINTFFTCLL